MSTLGRMKIVRDRVEAEDSYVAFVRRAYIDREGREKQWSFVQRREDRRAVIVIPTVRSRANGISRGTEGAVAPATHRRTAAADSGPNGATGSAPNRGRDGAYDDAQDRIVFLRQFRVPFGAHVLEFPAGLVDPGETPEQTALRELREETGLNGKVRRISPPLSSSAGLTSEQVHLAFVEVEESDVENALGAGTLDSHESSEEIELLAVPRDKIEQFLAGRGAAGDVVDVKLFLFCALVAFR